MAGDWLKFEKTTLEKPEVFELSGILGIEPDAVIGKLLRVWNWFDDHSRDGNAPVTVTALLDRYAGVTGFVQAMEKIGWMEIDGDVMHIPKFDRHNGTPAKTRALSKVRTQKHRSKDENEDCNAECNDDSVTHPLQNRYKVVTREEKRREDIFTSSLATAGEECFDSALPLDLPPPTPKPPKKQRARNELMDAIALHAEGSDPSQVTQSKWGAIAKSLAEIKAVSPNVTPEEIAARCAQYRKIHPEWALTATALLNHWAALVPQPSKPIKGRYDHML